MRYAPRLIFCRQFAEFVRVAGNSRDINMLLFVDQSIALAALGISPNYFNNDLDLFGHVFENMVLRDLSAYAAAHDARVMHYTDDTGLEADAVYQLEDGSYALIEVKTGANQIVTAEKTLLKFRDVIFVILHQNISGK